MIAIVDYGLGNVLALANIYNRLDIAATLARSADDLGGASHVILPGVGAFDWAMSRLEQSGMRAALDDLVLRQGKPVLGICVGMQMMARHSDEGQAPGLGWFEARVERFDPSRFDGPACLPHMGWNDVDPCRAHRLLGDLGDDARFYFLHSYFFAPEHEADILATTVYGDRFACAVQKDNIFGVQFHPEKSHQWGVRLLRNFAGL